MPCLALPSAYAHKLPGFLFHMQIWTEAVTNFSNYSIFLDRMSFSCEQNCQNSRILTIQICECCLCLVMAEHSTHTEQYLLIIVSRFCIWWRDLLAEVDKVVYTLHFRPISSEPYHMNMTSCTVQGMTCPALMHLYRTVLCTCDLFFAKYIWVVNICTPCESSPQQPWRASQHPVPNHTLALLTFYTCLFVVLSANSYCSVLLLYILVSQSCVSMLIISATRQTVFGNNMCFINTRIHWIPSSRFSVTSRHMRLIEKHALGLLLKNLFGRAWYKPYARTADYGAVLYLCGLLYGY